jgi:hypothetical protein
MKIRMLHMKLKDVFFIHGFLTKSVDLFLENQMVEVNME